MSIRRRIHAFVSASLVAVLATAAVQGLPQTAGAQSADDRPFTALRDFTPSGPDVRVRPGSYSAHRVDMGALRGALGTSTVAVPDPSGELQRFRVERTTLMESQLAGAHPEIATYAGRGLDDRQATIALDLTPMGFHASVRGSNGQRAWYVDPAFNGRGTIEHLSYYGAALPTPEQRRIEGETQAIRDTVSAKLEADALADQPVERRLYRLALTSDPSYAAYFGTANVLAEKVTLINRVNQIYNDDLAVSLRLVNATDDLNLDTDAKATGTNGPCGAAPCFEPPTATTDGELEFCDVPTLGKNRTVLGQLVGASDYDIGHVALGVNGGGIAYLGVVGGDYKAGGCTGLPEPRGDFFAIDYVAHEFGHQFAGNHTFNGALGACGGNISQASVEPGSGSSVMAYAGICRQDDLQPHTDPYFSFRTVDEVTAYTGLTPFANVEVQTVSLREFNTNGEQIVLGSGSGSGTVALTRGADYTQGGIDAAVESLTGRQVSIVQWGFDEVVANPGLPSDAGFQVIFNDTPSVFSPDASDVDLPSLTVTSPSPGVSGFVGETARGGSSQNGGTVATTDNIAPVVAAPSDKTLPMRTPFALTGAGRDADGDALVYLWEQTDFGGADGTPLADNNKTNGPLFRVFGTAADVTNEDTLKSPSPGLNIADGSPTRVFPDLAQVLAGNTNGATGACPTPTTPPTQMMSLPLRECYSEFLPKAGYVGTVGSTVPAMHFRLTARDRFVNGGGLAFDDVTLTLDPTKGPFLVTSQATTGTVTGGAGTPVTWAVNGTQTLAANVRITLSTDGGTTFGTVLAARTPNDGSQTLTMPNVSTTQARIKIEAVDNYFFDLNDAVFTIVADPSAPDTKITNGPQRNGFELDREVEFDYSSTEPGATFVCTLDGKPVTCAADGVTVRVKPGPHSFTVAAVDASGNTDATPATRAWARPLDDRALTRSGFRKATAKSAYLRTYVRADREGATLTEKIKRATKIALVVGTGKGYGKVVVFLGKKKLRTIDLAAKQTRFGVIVKVKTLKKPTSGLLTIRTLSDRTVRVDGLGVLGR